MIDRRFALTGLAAAAGAATFGKTSTAVAATNNAAVAATNNAAVAATNNAAAASSITAMDRPVPGLGPRMNMAQAYKVMDQLNIDALVVGVGLNFYHATGFWPLTQRMGHAPMAFAIVTRNDSQPVATVMSAFNYYYQLADVHSSDDFEVYLFTAPTGEMDDNGNPIAAPVQGFRDLQQAELDRIEIRRTSLADAAAKEIAAQAGAKYAMSKALKDFGLEKGTLAVDHPNVKALLSEAAPQATLVDADTALRRIRPVKSDLEINLMRQASAANTEAALAAVRAVRAGATYQDLRSVFYAEAARRGNRGVFMVIDRVSSELYDAPFQDGQAFLIDAVSEQHGYHGDYGRTVFLGEPTRAMAKATTAMGQAWDIVRESLRPGITFRDIMQTGKEALQKIDADYTISFTPHSVGLYHTDHVGNAGAAAFRENPVLEKGMILSVDCPLLEAGVGGSAHLEDLTLITEDGSEPIHDIGNQTIMV